MIRWSLLLILNGLIRVRSEHISKVKLILQMVHRSLSFQHVQIAENDLDITDYRYHYMNADGQMIFRYDNAPHHRELNTFPHHKHLQAGLQCAVMPTIKDILEEIDLIIMETLV